MLDMINSFPHTKEDIMNASKYDDEKHSNINKHLTRFFETKKTALEKIARIDCFNDGMEKFTICDHSTTGIYGFCNDETFGGWEVSFSLHWNAKFDCEQEFPIGFYLHFQYKDFIDVMAKLSKLDDSEIISEQKFNAPNKLTLITGFRKYL